MLSNNQAVNCIYVLAGHPGGHVLMLTRMTAAGVEPEQVTDQSRHVFMDFKLSQIKTISFLTYLLRTFPNLVAPHLQQLSDALVQLMRTCPDIAAMRKELLVTARHTFGSNHRG